MKPVLDDYRLGDTAELLTPCLLVYESLLKRNIEAALSIAVSADRLRPHVKTHKTPAIVRLLASYGVRKHKCATLAEAVMLAECGAADVLIAYPLVGPNVRELQRICESFPNTLFSCLVDNSEAAEELCRLWSQDHTLRSATRVQSDLPVYVDINTGMHRTGIAAGQDAIALYKQLSAADGISVAGLHVYDGQNHQSSRDERQLAVAELMRGVVELLDALRGEGVVIPKLICGGTPTFPVFAEMKLPPAYLDVKIELSPGTSVLWDAGYGADYADLAVLQPAAILLTRVVSKPQPGHLTLDLGHKAVAADPPAGSRCHFLAPADAQEIRHSEEHLVIATQEASDYSVGDVLYALPTHICPTVALHSHLQVVRDGLACEEWPVARDRLYRTSSAGRPTSADQHVD